MASGMPSLAQLIDPRTREGELWEPLPEGRLRCYACGHRCLILPGLRGICRVRYNEGGRLRVPWGYVAGLQLDPVEKKPFFHAWPGAKALSFGMLGCDFKCGYCQNALTSQALRDPAMGTPPQEVTPADIVAAAKRTGARILTSTYNEPLITSEWGVEIFKAGPRRRPGRLLRLERQRHVRGARLHPPLGGPLQGRPEVFRRPALPPARAAC